MRIYRIAQKEESQKWWGSLSINEMKALTRKYYPNPHITWSFINQTPGLIEDIYQKEHNISSSAQNSTIKTAQFEEIEDVYSSVSDEHESILREYYRKGRKKGTMMSWSVIPFARLKKIWEDYSKTGVVRDEAGVNEIANHMLKNLARLHAATDLSGHSQFGMGGEGIAEDMGLKPISEKNAWDFYNYFLETPYGTPVSDYGLEPLWKLAEQLTSTGTAEQKLLIIDQMLNVCHQRGDLAALFIEGGSNSLSQLSKAPEEVVEAKMKIGNWYKIASTESDIKDVKGDVKDAKKDVKDLEKRVKDLEKTIEALNIGKRQYWLDRTVFNSLQRRFERMENVEQEWKKYKNELSDDVKREVEKHTKGRAGNISPRAT